jgi:hypothetical protein
LLGNSQLYIFFSLRVFYAFRIRENLKEFKFDLFPISPNLFIFSFHWVHAHPLSPIGQAARTGRKRGLLPPTAAAAGVAATAGSLDVSFPERPLPHHLLLPRRGDSWVNHRSPSPPPYLLCYSTRVQLRACGAATIAGVPRMLPLETGARFSARAPRARRSGFRVLSPR